VERRTLFTFIHYTTTTTTVLRPFIRDHPGEPVPEENFWTLWCKGRLTEANTPTIRLGTTSSGLTSAHLHHPPKFLQAGCPPCRPTNSVKALKASDWLTSHCLSVCKHKKTQYVVLAAVMVDTWGWEFNSLMFAIFASSFSKLQHQFHVPQKTFHELLLSHYVTQQPWPLT